MSAYSPEYINQIESPDDIINGIRNTLETWLMIHTDAETWVNEWTCQEDESIIEDLLKTGISNDYFSFDVKDAVVKEWCKDKVHYFVKCENCGFIAEEYYNDECSCEAEDEEGNTIELDDDRWVNCELEDLIQHMDDMGGFETINQDDQINYVIDALLNEGFKVYREALKYITGPIEQDCIEAIKQIDEALTNEDRLYAAMQAAGIYHINGEIMRDYGDRVGFDYNNLNKLRSEGLQAFFNSETIKEWLED